MVDKRRNRRRQVNKRKRPRRRLKIFNIAIICFLLFLFFVGIFYLFHILTTNPTQNNIEVVEETEAELTSFEKTSNNIEKYSEKLSKKFEYLEKNIKDKDEDVSVIYYDINSKEKYFYNNGQISLENNNIVLAIILEKLSNAGMIDMQEIINISNISSKNTLSLNDIVFEMFKENSSWSKEIIKEKITPFIRYDWISYANKKLNINISQNKNINLKEFVKIIDLLFEKENNEFMYKYTINNLYRLAKHKEDVVSLAKNNYMGYYSSSNRTNELEFGFIEDELDYFYLIFSDKKEADSIESIRNVIYNWKNEFNY